MSKYPTSMVDQPQPLSDFALDEAATEALNELTDKGYSILVGLSPEYADAIIAMAQEPAIREYCPNDAGSRFADKQATINWLEKGRSVFLLVEPQDYGNRLVGYGWVGQGTSQHVPGGETTFAIRIGEIGQGKGLAAPFIKVMLAVGKNFYDAKNMWLETWKSNGAAVHVYHKVGFTDVAEVDGERPAVDGDTVSDRRVYMKLD